MCVAVGIGDLGYSAPEEAVPSIYIRSEGVPIYIREHTHSEERRSDAKTMRDRVSRPKFVSVGVVSRITRPPRPTHLHPPLSPRE